MTYNEAKACFQENGRHLSPESDPVLWNLNAGLDTLTDAIEQDMAHLRDVLDRVVRALEREA